jgi:sarcosine oxidase subunit gamma
MAEVAMRSPFAHRLADLVRLDAVEVPFLVQLAVRCSADAAERLGFPIEPNTATGDMDRGVLWLGPDEWLVVSGAGTEAAVGGELASELTGTHHAIVDVGANRGVLELRGEQRLALLATGCGLDLDPRGGWAPGRCAQTLFARAPVLLQELPGATRVFVRPSFADYVVDRLLAAKAIL